MHNKVSVAEYNKSGKFVQMSTSLQDGSLSAKDYYEIHKDSFDRLSQLAIEKEEQESRKDFLEVGSSWRCTHTNIVRIVETGVCHTGLKGQTVDIVNIVHTLVYFTINKGECIYSSVEDQFLLCYRPLASQNTISGNILI